VIGLVIAIGLLIAVAIVALRWAKALEQLRKSITSFGEGKPTRPILADVGGPVGRLIGLFGAVAPRLEGRIAQLEGDRQQLSAVLSGMAEGVIAIDARRRLLFANASADRLFGLGPGSVGRLVPELIRSPQVQEAVEATLAGH